MVQLSEYQRVFLRQSLRRSIRDYFDQQSYLEVDSPIGVLCPGSETYLRYFKTEWFDFQKRSHPLFLRSSPEIHMKQILSKEMPRIYQLGPCFRNHGESSPWHHPEFTMLEWYQADLTFLKFMDQIEEFLQVTSAAMIPHLASCGIDDEPWRSPVKLTHISVYEAFRQFANVTLIDEDPDLARKARGVGVISPREDDDFETAFFKILIEKIEPKIAALGPVLLYDYPPSQAALATVKGERAKRCEVYFGRVELSNGFEELLDPEANLSRFMSVQSKRAKLGFENPPVDPDFMTALHHSFIPSCGNALGFDRWLAILCHATDLDQVIPFRKSAAYSSKTSET